MLRFMASQSQTRLSDLTKLKQEVNYVPIKLEGKKKVEKREKEERNYWCSGLSTGVNTTGCRWTRERRVDVHPLFQFFVTPWTAGHQASLSFTISGRLLKPMSIESVMPSTISSSVASYSCPQSFAASGSF